MKRFLSSALMLIMLFTMTACDGDKSQKTAKPSDEVSAPETETENNSNQQTTKPVDQDSNPENNEPPQQITINGNVLTYQSTYRPDELHRFPSDQNTQIDLYIDEKQGEYKICRCGRPLEYFSGTPCEFYEGGIAKEQAIEIANKFLTQHFGDFFETMKLRRYSYDDSKYSQLFMSFQQLTGEDDSIWLRTITFELGRDGIPIAFYLNYHDHMVENLPVDEFDYIKKADLDAYAKNIIETDPKNVYQNVNKDDIETLHRIISKDGKIVLETILQGPSIGAEEYYRDPSEFD
ncbi:MAG: hypothetical protein IJN82_01655 [Clostridia bacterium]|nr:hypothetical protein [Clostridia bacterium]